MSCGLTRFLSRIKLSWYVLRHRDWKCIPTCWCCRYWETCQYEAFAEDGLHKHLKLNKNSVYGEIVK